jgi:hypothetical protein
MRARRCSEGVVSVEGVGQAQARMTLGIFLVPLCLRRYYAKALMYFPLVQDRVVLESSGQVWVVLYVDYRKEIADLESVTGPRRRLRGVCFDRLISVSDGFPAER